MHHPIRDHAINVYVGEAGAIAIIGDGSVSFPYFRGSTAEEAKAKAEAFVSKAIEENEAAFIARQIGAEKAKEKRKSKQASQ